MEKFVFFWKGPLSQWHKADMYDPRTQLTFNCAEQYMMYGKAELFGDTEAMDAIMCTSNPRKQQAIGRVVENYDQDVWDENARRIVAYGNYLKFTQNPYLLKELLSYGDVTFVEASPMDKVWGIGMAEDNPLIHDRENWKGKNWLGQCLTVVQAVIKDDNQFWDGDIDFDFYRG